MKVIALTDHFAASTANDNDCLLLNLAAQRIAATNESGIYIRVTSLTTGVQTVDPFRRARIGEDAVSIEGSVMARNPVIIAVALFLSCLLLSPPVAAQVPDAIAAPNSTKVLEVHAEGAQIYECKTGNAGKLVWQFREPIAALMLDGKTIGRHYLGPAWEVWDGSAVTGKVIAHSEGATAKDIPWLKLDALSHRGNGQLSAVTAIQRINSKGGVADGDCVAPGTFLSVPYSSDYVFLK